METEDAKKKIFVTPGSREINYQKLKNAIRQHFTDHTPVVRGHLLCNRTFSNAFSNAMKIRVLPSVLVQGIVTNVGHFKGVLADGDSLKTQISFR